MSSSELLNPGSCLGPNRIRRFLAQGDLGAYYEVTVGTAQHVYRLLVLSSAGNPGWDAVSDTIRPLAAVHHPCLCKPFVFGKDQGRVWIRMEQPLPVPFGSFQLPAADKKSPWPVGEMVINARRLRELFGGQVPQGTLYPLIADLLEGMLCLHRAGQALGPLDLESVVFQKDRHGQGVSAKWVDYGMNRLAHPGALSPDSFRSDVQAAGRLFRHLLCGEEGAFPLTVWPEWPEFLDRAEQERPDAFPDALEMRKAFTELLQQRGIERPPRQVAPEPPASDSSEGKRDSSGRTHERRKRVGANRRRYSESISANSMSAILVGPAFKVLFMIAGLCAVGFAAFWLVSHDLRQRRAGLVGPSVRILSEESLGEGEDSEGDSVWGLSREELAERKETGSLEAGMRLAFLLAQGDANHEPEEERGLQVAMVFVPKLEAELQEDRADAEILYWLAYALLTGLGADEDPERGLALLERAAGDQGHVRAMDLLADYHAAELSGDPGIYDRVALQWWRSALDATKEWSPLKLSMANKAMSFILQGRGLPRGDPSAFLKWIEDLARMQHLPSILAMGTLFLEGRIVSMDEPRAMGWFRTAALGGSAEGMRRMAWMFERGIGTPQSDRTALIWYRRAALAGDPDAMEHLASWIERGRADEEPDAEVVAEWRRKASEARRELNARAHRFSWWKPGSSKPPLPAFTPSDPVQEEGAPGASESVGLEAYPPPSPEPSPTPEEDPASVPLPEVLPELIEPDGRSLQPLG